MRTKVLVGYILFAAAGVLSVLPIRACLSWYWARSWIVSSATILSTDLEVTVAARSRGRSMSTRSVVAEYSYVWNGDEFRGTTVSPFNSIEGSADYKKRMAMSLADAFQSRRQVLCYVNPAHPDQAVLFREFRWSVVLVYMSLSIVFWKFGSLMVRTRDKVPPDST